MLRSTSFVNNQLADGKGIGAPEHNSLLIATELDSKRVQKSSQV